MWWSSEWGGCVNSAVDFVRIGSPIRKEWLKAVLYRCGFSMIALLLCGSQLFAQTPQPTERVSFDEAIRRAMAQNPSSAIAAADILRADALLQQARSDAGLHVTGSGTSTTLNQGIEFQGTTVTPQTSALGMLDIRYPLYAPVIWARRVEAADNRDVAILSADEIRRQTAVATADAYLTVIARRRVIEANIRSREVAQAHLDLATELEQRGSGSRLNRLRAAQEVSIDSGFIETAQFALYSAQEALGVLLTADGPVDAADVPAFEIPLDVAVSSALSARTDLKLFNAQEHAAERVLANNSRSYLPVFEGMFQPQSTYPRQFFIPSNSWQLLFQMTVPIVDSGYRAGERVAREATLNTARANVASKVASISSEVRTARESVASAERVLTTERQAAEQANQVVDIVNISFRAGASTNIEVIDAQRRARDADTNVAVAEDAVRRARFNLLNALGRFP
jgi:outer membrane protein